MFGLRRIPRFDQRSINGFVMYFQSSSLKVCGGREVELTVKTLVAYHTKMEVAVRMTTAGA
jgi:hypothetical protein